LSKLVNPGHWLVAAIFVASGFVFLYEYIIPDLIYLVRGDRAVYPEYLRYFSALPFFVCAWGILKWESWARDLGIGLSIFELLSVVIILCFAGLRVVGVSAVVFLALICIKLIWLRLPAVSAEFSRRNQIA
jgi:hypothetical protein